MQNGMYTIWLGGTDFQQEGIFVWDNAEQDLINFGYRNWNTDQVT
jgi:hypothetical protein